MEIRGMLFECFSSLSLHGGKVYELTKIQFVEAPVT